MATAEKRLCRPPASRPINEAQAKTWNAFNNALINYCANTHATMDEALEECTKLLQGLASPGTSEPVAFDAMELHHRIGNELQQLGSLMRLRSQSAEIDANGPPCSSCIAQVSAIARLHDVLRVTPGDHDVDLYDFLKPLCALFGSSHAVGERISLHFSGQSLTVRHADALTIAMIVNEALTNAVKHGFRDGRSGWVRVFLARDGADVGTIRIADSGAGPSGTQSSGSGLKLLKALAAKIGGKLSFSVSDNGVVVECTFPIHTHENKEMPEDVQSV